MRLQAVPILMATLAVCSASSKRPTQITQTTESQVYAAPRECYTKNNEVGKCVRPSMCDKETIAYPTPDLYKNDCNFLMTCCPIDKLREKSTQPVQPTISTPPGCGYSNAAFGSFRELMGTSYSGYANFAEFPWMVALLKNSVNNQESGWNNSDYIGGGTLIHPSVVLTVAHKVYRMAPSDLKCRAGEWDAELENEVYIHQDREVKTIILHDQFNTVNALYDVALLIMKTPFLLQPHINVACLSSIMPPPGTLCFSMGWGRDFTEIYNAKVLKKIPRPLIRPDECERMFRKSILGNNYLLHHTLTCAGGLPNIDMRDGGSSLVCPVGDPAESRYTVVGMVVYGLRCGSECPGTYAKIPELYNWINQQMNMEGFPDRLYTI